MWFYDKRKWEGKTLSTKLASDGGCCIWYDGARRAPTPHRLAPLAAEVDEGAAPRHTEPSHWRSIEKRIGSSIETLDAFLARSGGVQTLAAYGQAKDGGLNERSSANLSALSADVGELAALEVQAQHAFLLNFRPPTVGGGGQGGAHVAQKVPVPQAAALASEGSPGDGSAAGGARGGGKKRGRGGGGKGGGKGHRGS